MIRWSYDPHASDTQENYKNLQKTLKLYNRTESKEGSDSEVMMSMMNALYSLHQYQISTNVTLVNVQKAREQKCLQSLRDVL